MDRKACKLYLSHSRYLNKVLDKFNMGNFKVFCTALATHFKLSAESCAQSEEDIEKMPHVPYSSAVGGLCYGVH